MHTVYSLVRKLWKKNLGKTYVAAHTRNTRVYWGNKTI